MSSSEEPDRRHYGRRESDRDAYDVGVLRGRLESALEGFERERAELRSRYEQDLRALQDRLALVEARGGDQCESDRAEARGSRRVIGILSSAISLCAGALIASWKEIWSWISAGR